MSNKHFLIIFYIFGTTIYFIYTLHYPIFLDFNAIGDDALFIQQAKSIISGEWLGKYNSYTLIKGPFYSIFLAFNYLIGTNIVLLQSFLFILSLFIFIKVVRDIFFSNDISKNKLYSYCIFLFYIFVLFDQRLLSTRIIRDNIYIPITIITLSSPIYAFIYSKRCNIPLFSFFGLFVGFFYITREEGIWILPYLALIFILGFIHNKKKYTAKYYIMNNIFIFIFSSLTILTLSLINYIYYNTFTINEIKYSSFTEAYKNLRSVNVGDQKQYLSIPKKTRESIYKISDSFNDIKYYIENDPTTNILLSTSCDLYPHLCGDYTDGHFLWAFRYAVDSAGHYNTPQQAESFYKKISSDIKNSCENGYISCTKPIFSFMHTMPEKFFTKILLSSLDATKNILYINFNPYNNKSSNIYTNDAGDMINILGNPRYSYKNNIISYISGWYYSEDRTWISLSCFSKYHDGFVKIVPEKLESPDVSAHFNDPLSNKQRFTLRNIDKACLLFFENDDKDYIKIENIHSNIQIQTKKEKSILYIDKAIYPIDRKNLIFLFEKFFIYSYKILIPVYFSIGLISFLATFFILVIKKKIHYTFTIASSLWLLFILRIFILSVINITSFPAFSVEYLKPAQAVIHISSLFSILTLIYTVKNINSLPNFTIKFWKRNISE